MTHQLLPVNGNVCIDINNVSIVGEILDAFQRFDYAHFGAHSTDIDHLRHALAASSSVCIWKIKNFYLIVVVISLFFAFKLIK